MNTWNELTVHVNREAEEAVSNLLIETGSQGVAISDSADYLGQEDRFGELYPEVEQSDMIVITAYYPDTLDIEAVKADLAEILKALVLRRVASTLTVRNWSKRTGLITGRSTMSQLALPMI